MRKNVVLHCIDKYYLWLAVGHAMPRQSSDGDTVTFEVDKYKVIFGYMSDI